MQVEDHFEDQYCHYIVFELARGGDLLEALKLRPHGFEESQAQFLIGQAARGLVALHHRRLAMQDVSLENMLLHVLDDGQYQVKICDPGQAVLFETDPQLGELPVEFRGFVGKSFRPPELTQQAPYYATKVDAWCLGWSTFYLLAAQPLFMSADPAQQDPDWTLFERGEFSTLFRQKATSCSQKGIDFILRLLQIDPRRRMSVAEALQHSWLADSELSPMFAPKDLLPPKVDKLDRPQDDGNNHRDQKSEQNATPTGGHAANTPMEAASPSVGSGPVGLAYGGNLHGGYASAQQQAARHRSGQQDPGRYSQVQPAPAAPSWKMAPQSRSGSPGPGSGVHSTTQLRPGLLQGLGSAGTPQLSQYPATQVRNPSPFTAANRGATPGSISFHRRSPSPPPRPGTSALMRTPTGDGSSPYLTRDNGASWTDLVNNQTNQTTYTSATAQPSFHTPRLARPAAMHGIGADTSHGEHADGDDGREASNTWQYKPASAGQDTGGVVRGGSDAGSHHLGAPGDADGRFGSLGDAFGGRSSVNRIVGSGHRPSSPAPAPVMMRPSNQVRGISPSPMRTVGSLDSSWMQRQQGMMPGQHQTSTPSFSGAMRGSSGANMPSIDPGGQWHSGGSPRAASPVGGGGVLRGQEVYSRGRSATRTLSPAAQLIGGVAYGSSGASMMRTSSPSMMAQVPARAGFAWSPVPPSPPAPKRSISPTPAGLMVMQPNNTLPRWPC
eukprot:gnl/TRDRNA2_/TRDRNA2_33201_c0_seq1.p1 gnl/TRDRNA2_/TRDRNA2_33201_c0~~gnl/TRDRNA2_/TRDRNA2_33201_c0_seq1.p1  ORF type:complete len:839 (+),score=113.86 gnl/TRDRNA2_/TRDRNA2_33201_c0_seq1:347-2518(+)